MKNIFYKLKDKNGFSIIELLVTIVIITSALIIVQKAMDETMFLHRYGTIYEDAENRLRLATMECGGNTTGLKRLAKKYSNKHVSISIQLKKKTRYLTAIKFQAIVRLIGKRKKIEFTRYYFKSSMKPEHSNDQASQPESMIRGGRQSDNEDTELDSEDI